jgi:diaminohydroxyphosphoribosylaminopyrimidine deaminase/5-amino-6-(5-phosphoribosylamino)uracil reductase
VDDRAARDDLSFMREALHVAGRIPRRPWPNPPVGALVVLDGRIVGRGAHHGAGAAHAEMVALDQAGPRARGATLYCTLEPCNHQGRTPPCAPRVASSGIGRLVVAVIDPNPHVAGRGLDVVRDAGIEVTVGVAAEEALELVWPFVITAAFERPFVVLKTATSLDGRFAPTSRRAEGGPAYLTGPEARHDVHRLRRWSDVVLVGKRTKEVDEPQLNGRLTTDCDACPAAEPLPAYVDTDLTLTAGWPGRAHWVFAGVSSAPVDRQQDVERQHGTVVLCDERDGHVAPEALVDAFARRGGHCLLIEGGPTLAAACLQAGIVDRCISYVAPQVLGDGVSWPSWIMPGDGAHAATLFTLTRVMRSGPDAKLVFDRADFAQALARVSGGVGTVFQQSITTP